MKRRERERKGIQCSPIIACHWQTARTTQPHPSHVAREERSKFPTWNKITNKKRPARHLDLTQTPNGGHWDVDSDT
jgi:hypothetical protein